MKSTQRNQPNSPAFGEFKVSDTLFDKVWQRHVVTRYTDEALIYIDRVLLQEGANHAFRSLAAMNRRARRPRNAIACADHYVPTTDRARGVGAHNDRPGDA